MDDVERRACRVIMVDGTEVRVQGGAMTAEDEAVVASFARALIAQESARRDALTEAERDAEDREAERKRVRLQALRDRLRDPS